MSKKPENRTLVLSSHEITTQQAALMCAHHLSLALEFYMAMESERGDAPLAVVEAAKTFLSETDDAREIVHGLALELEVRCSEYDREDRT